VILGVTNPINGILDLFRGFDDFWHSGVCLLIGDLP
jgi:hypothetical protein